MTALYRINFQSANNEDLRHAFALTDSTGTAVNLTGAGLHMDLVGMAGVGSVAPVVVATTSNGRIALVSGADGQFEIALPAALMRTLPAGVYRHDLLLTLADRIQRVWEGTLTLSQGVTQ
jgi:hypothetical protein